MADEFVSKKIRNRKVVIFSKSYCPFCTKVKNIFSVYLNSCVLDPEDYEVVEIDDNPDYERIQGVLQRVTGEKTVPRVFINGKSIGGGEAITHLDASGDLKGLLLQ